MTTQILNVTVDGVTDISRLPGQSAIQWFGTPPATTYADIYSVYHSSPGDDLEATAYLTGSNWRIKYFRIAGDDHHTTIKDLDDNAGRRIETLMVGYNSDVDLVSTRVDQIIGWDGDKHEVTLGDLGRSVNFIRLDAKENFVETGSDWVDSLSTYGKDTIKIGSGGAGAVRTGNGNAVVTANGWVESIRTRDGNDTIVTKAEGATAIRTGNGTDKVTTKAGFVDMISTDESRDIVNIGAGGAGSVRLQTGNDQITTGSGFVVSISAGEGNDVVRLGEGGAAQVLLGAGNDKIYLSELAVGSDESVTMSGKAGVDTIYFTGFSTGVTFSLANTGLQDVANDKGLFQQSGFENLTGSNKSDTLRGNDDKNTVIGNSGADKMWGGKQDDTLKGGAGNDTLSGENGRDNLQGGKGKDLLDGGNGNDTLRGDQGADVFVFGKKSGTDTVMDYQDGTDTLRLVGHTGGFSDLTIKNQSGDRVIEHDNGIIILDDLARLKLTAADFDFV